MLELEHVEPKALETIAGSGASQLAESGATLTLLPLAALSMEPPAHFPVLCKKALRVALSLLKKQAEADLPRCRQGPRHLSPPPDTPPPHTHTPGSAVCALCLCPQ